MPNRFQPIQAGTDPSQQLAIINKNFGELDAENVKKLFYDSNGIPSIQIGVQQDGTSRIKVSLLGIDVTTATDNQLAFDSSRNTYRIVTTIPLTLTFTRSSSTFASYVTSANHGLTFMPSYQYNLSIDPAISVIPPSSKFAGSYIFAANVGGSFSPFGQAYCTVDATKVYFQIDMSSLSTGTYTCTASVDILQKTFS